VPFEEEDESPFVGLLRVAAAELLVRARSSHPPDALGRAAGMEEATPAVDYLVRRTRTKPAADVDALAGIDHSVCVWLNAL
jgi:hypothetical protein